MSQESLESRQGSPRSSFQSGSNPHDSIPVVPSDPLLHDSIPVVPSDPLLHDSIPVVSSDPLLRRFIPVVSSDPLLHRFSSLHKNRGMGDPSVRRSQIRDSHDSLVRDSRSSLLDRLRGITLNGDDAVSDDTVSDDTVSDDTVSDDAVSDDGVQSRGRPVFVPPRTDDADDWGDPTMVKPSVDLRCFNFHLPGILCPYCRSNMMVPVDRRERTVMKEGYGLVRELVASHMSCFCGFELEVTKTSEDIKRNIISVLSEHEVICPSNQSPHYTLFSSNIVLSCDFCNLAQIVS